MKKRPVNLSPPPYEPYHEIPIPADRPGRPPSAVTPPRLAMPGSVPWIAGGILTAGAVVHAFDPPPGWVASLAAGAFGWWLAIALGIVMVGLYNRYARVPSWVRSKLIRFLGPKIDYVVRRQIRSAQKAHIWIKDQYSNPHESWHSVDEVRQWFEENGIEYLNCSPPILGTDGEEAETLFCKTDLGSRYQRVVTQLAWIGSIAREGGLFDVIGRRTE